MANKITDEVFKRISHEFLYDVSQDAVIKFLNANSYDVNDLNDLTDDMVDFLLKNIGNMYAFARKNGLHNKHLPEFSPEEEELPGHIFRGLNNVRFRAKEKMKFAFKGCDDNTYFGIFYDSRIEYVEHDRERSEYRISTETIAELVEVHIDEDYNISYDDPRLNRTRCFKSTENFIKKERKEFLGTKFYDNKSGKWF